MTYVALLRGINVGGNAKVEMSRLKQVFDVLGCVHVQTYINSGNVIFDDTRSRQDIASRLEQKLEAEFGFFIPVLIRDQAVIANMCRAIPADWTNDSVQKTDVMFLWQAVDEPTIIDKVTINPAIENVRYIAGALVWNIARQNVTKGNGIKLIKTDLYKYMTVRNINTVRKIYQLMQARQGV